MVTVFHIYISVSEIHRLKNLTKRCNLRFVKIWYCDTKMIIFRFQTDDHKIMTPGCELQLREMSRVLTLKLWMKRAPAAVLSFGTSVDTARVCRILLAVPPSSKTLSHFMIHSSHTWGVHGDSSPKGCWDAGDIPPARGDTRNSHNTFLCDKI